MSGKHAQGQQMLGFRLDADFRAEIEVARGRVPLSQFVRDAITEKLLRMGIHIDEDKVIAPSRAGKGGPRKKADVPGSYPPHKPRSMELNEPKTKPPKP